MNNENKQPTNLAVSAIFAIALMSFINALIAAGIYLMGSVLLPTPIIFLDAFRFMWGLTLALWGYSLFRDLKF